MSPPISKDWWIAAALTSATLPAAIAQTAATTAPRVGVVSAATSDAPASSAGKTVVVGNDVTPGQRLSTGPNGQLHVLLLDQSALTLGPDTELVIEAFAFDPASKQGQIRLGLTKGVLRVVGGHISKTQATVVATPQGKVEILGGITMVETSGNSTSGTFLFGQSMRVTDNSGNTQTVTRPGFSVSANNAGSVSPPLRLNPSAMSTLLQRFDQPTGAVVLSPRPQPLAIQSASGSAPPSVIVGPPSATSLAADRVPAATRQFTTITPDQTLRNILGSGQSPNQS